MTGLDALRGFTERIAQEGLDRLRAAWAVKSPSEEILKQLAIDWPTLQLEFKAAMDTVDRLTAAVRAARRRPNRGSNPSRYARRRRRGR